MQGRLLAFTLLLVSLLNGQQKLKEKSFVDCDKTAQTQADLNECGNNDYQSADDELNRTYQQLLKKAASDPIAVRKIQAAQRTWIAFRDAQLAALFPAEDKQRDYGTVFPMCASLALADLTRERTKMLKQMLNPVEGDVCGGGLLYPEPSRRTSPSEDND